MKATMGRILAVVMAAVSVPVSRSGTGLSKDRTALLRCNLPWRSLRLMEEDRSNAKAVCSSYDNWGGLGFSVPPCVKPGALSRSISPAAACLAGRNPTRPQLSFFPPCVQILPLWTSFRILTLSSKARNDVTEGSSLLPLNKFVYEETLQCPKLGWHRRRRLVQEEQTEAERLLAQQGEQIEEAFTGQRYEGTANEIRPSNNPQQAMDTQLAMREIEERFGKEVPGTTKASAVTQATFLAGGCVARADAVEYAGDGQWDLVEVKSCTDKSYGKHLTDLAFTVHTAMESGVKVRCALLVTINSDFRLGMPAGDIFRVLNCTEELFGPGGPIATLQGAASRAASLAHVAEVTALSEAPEGVPASSCKQCPLFRACVAKDVQHPIWHLPRLTGKRFEQVSSVSLDIKDVADDMLTAAQKKHRECVVRGAPIVNRKALRKALAALAAPLHFLDFESFATWTSPLEQVVSQYSLHSSPSLSVARPEDAAHREFLGAAHGDFRAELLHRLLDDLGSAGSILVYSPYEQTQLRKMAKMFPEREEEIEAVVDRLVDLEPLIRANVQHPDFQGRTSLKVTLPVLVPSYSGRYKALGINDGAHAAAAFQRIRGPPPLPPAEEAALREELLQYCRLDTLAMVELLQALQALSQKPRDPPPAA